MSRYSRTDEFLVELDELLDSEHLDAFYASLDPEYAGTFVRENTTVHPDGRTETQTIRVVNYDTTKPKEVWEQKLIRTMREDLMEQYGVAINEAKAIARLKPHHGENKYSDVTGSEWYTTVHCYEDYLNRLTRNANPSFTFLIFCQEQLGYLKQHIHNHKNNKGEVRKEQFKQFTMDTIGKNPLNYISNVWHRLKAACRTLVEAFVDWYHTTGTYILFRNLGRWAQKKSQTRRNRRNLSRDLGIDKKDFELQNGALVIPFMGGEYNSKAIELHDGNDYIDIDIGSDVEAIDDLLGYGNPSKWIALKSWCRTKFRAAGNWANTKLTAGGNWASTKLTAGGEWLDNKWLDVQIWFDKTSLDQWIKERKAIAVASNINPNGAAHENPLYERGEENPSTYKLTISELPDQECSKGWAEDMSSESEEDHTRPFIFDRFRRKPSTTTVVEADEDSMEHAHHNPLFDDPNPK